jgi:ribosomal protein L12E/L44/L45/RPP1/RPP2
VSVLPKEFVFENAVAELEDDQIDELILRLRQRALEARAAPPTLLASPAKVSNEPEPRH